MRLLRFGNKTLAIRENGEIKLLYDNIPIKVSELENDLNYVKYEELEKELEEYATKDLLNKKIDDILGDTSGKTLDTIEEIAEALNDNKDILTTLASKKDLEEIKTLLNSLNIYDYRYTTNAYVLDEKIYLDNATVVDGKLFLFEGKVLDGKLYL